MSWRYDTKRAQKSENMNKSIVTIFKLLIGSTFSLSTILVAQDAFVSTINWKEGEKVQYVIGKSKHFTDAGSVARASTTYTNFEITVLKKYEHSYLISWLVEDTSVAGANAFELKFLNLMQGVRLEYEISNSGELLNIANLSDVQNEMFDVISQIIKAMIASGEMGEQQAKIFEQHLRGLYESGEQLEQLISRDIRMYFLAHGFEHSLDEHIKYKEDLHNPYGGSAFPTSGKFILEDLDFKTKQATITFSQSLDTKTSKKVITETTKRISEQSGKPTLLLLDVPEFVVTDSGQIKLNLETGWLESLTSTRNTNLAGDAQIETTTITRR